MVTGHIRRDEYAEYVRQLFSFDGEPNMQTARAITFQVTDDCTLRCSYCYEHHKACRGMNLETGRRIVDQLLDLYEKGDSDFINPSTRAVVLDFIGGEPLLEAALIEHICDYWFSECWRRKIPLAPFTRISFATNGQLWFGPEAQHLFEKYHEMMAVTVSIDGVKELHDKYRLDASGIGSFDKAWAAFQDGKKYGWHNSKMTFVPGSIKYIAPSVKMMVNEGCEIIHCNFAYEPVYTAADAREIFDALKELSDWLIDAKKDVYISMLDEPIGTPKPQEENENYCGGTGAMLSFSPDGKAYPCIRYAPISVGEELAESMCLGDCYAGLYTTKRQQDTKAMLDAITRASQSSQKCLDCPVATGCGWCSGYNYEHCGTPNCRTTNICLAHKGRVLGAYYYHNKRYISVGDCIPRVIYMPYDEAKAIIGEKAARELWKMQEKALIKFADADGAD